MNTRSMAIAAAVLLPLGAMAQGGASGGQYGAGGAGAQAGGAQGGGQGQGVNQLGSGAGTYAAGTINGTVEAVNVGKGVLTVRSGNGNVTVNALPGQIAQLNPGDVVSLQYANFNGALWVAEQGNGQQGMGNVPFTNEGRITGAINNLGRAQGTITVRGATFRIHPQQVQGLFPGQFVSVTYAQVGGTNWVTAVKPAQGAPSSQNAAPQGGNQRRSMGNTGQGNQGNQGAQGNQGNQ